MAGFWLLASLLLVLLLCTNIMKVGTTTTVVLLWCCTTVCRCVPVKTFILRDHSGSPQTTTQQSAIALTVGDAKRAPTIPPTTEYSAIHNASVAGGYSCRSTIMYCGYDNSYRIPSYHRKLLVGCTGVRLELVGMFTEGSIFSERSCLLHLWLFVSESAGL